MKSLKFLKLIALTRTFMMNSGFDWTRSLSACVCSECVSPSKSRPMTVGPCIRRCTVRLCGSVRLPRPSSPSLFVNSHPFYSSRLQAAIGTTELQCTGCFPCSHSDRHKNRRKLRWDLAQLTSAFLRNSMAKRTSKFHHSRNQTFAHPYRLTLRVYERMTSRYCNENGLQQTYLLSISYEHHDPLYLLAIVLSQSTLSYLELWKHPRQWIRMTQAVYGLRSSWLRTV